MKTSRSAAPKLPPLPSQEAWIQSWRTHWQHAGQSGYELPVGGPGHHDREFLKQARTPGKDDARLGRIQREFQRGFRGLFKLGPAVTVFGSARFRPSHPYYRLARNTGAELARAGFATLTGGGPGIMEAANRGAREAGGTSYGLNIKLPTEQSVNPYLDHNIEFQYFFTRKVCLVKYSCAFIVMPGGLGTLDELFEAATLIQCQKIGPFPIVLMGTQFWNGLREWSQRMMAEGVFGRDEIGFAYITDSPRDAVELVAASVPAAVRERLRPLSRASTKRKSQSHKPT